MGFTKTLNFTYKNLPASQLVFTFDVQKIENYQLYENFFPVVWKVNPLHPNGKYQFHVIYEQQFAFATAQIDQGKVVIDQAVQDIDFQQTTSLTGDATNGYTWSAPQQNLNLDPNEFVGTNHTSKGQNVAVCTDPGFASPLLSFDVPVGAGLAVEFNALLRVYSVGGIEETDILRTQITSEVIWSVNLATLDPSTNWVITYDTNSLNYVISPYTGE